MKAKVLVAGLVVAVVVAGCSKVDHGKVEATYNRVEKGSPIDLREGAR